MRFAGVVKIFHGDYRYSIPGGLQGSLGASIWVFWPHRLCVACDTVADHMTREGSG